MFYEAGFCDFLLNKLDLAQEIWKKNFNDNLGSRWGLIVLDLIKNKIPDIKPKYFQIRAYYEIFISLLIENSMFDYAEALIKSYKYLTSFNLETPKFIARVLHSYAYDDSSLKFIDISLSENYTDIEALYIGAQIYCSRNELENAKKYIKLILETAPSYYPALQLKNRYGF